MTRWATLLAASSLLLVSGSVADATPSPAFKLRSLDVVQVQPPLVVQQQQLAQAAEDNEEPVPPGGTTPAKSDEPGGAKSDEPGGAATGEPAGAPAPAPAGEPEPVVRKVKKEISYGAGFQFRGIFVPEWFLGMFLDQSTGLASVSLGGEFVRRKGNFDIVASINFGFYSPPDGNFLGNGKAAQVDTDYLQFDALNLLSFGVAFVWHHEFTPWLSLVYGAGLGLGIVLGDIYRVSNDGCNGENVGDTTKCNPVPGTGSGKNPASLKEWNENPDAWLTKYGQSGCPNEGPGSPCQFVEDDVWPVVPIVHLLIGLDFKINEQFSVRVDGGFHDAFYFGATGHYFF